MSQTKGETRAAFDVGRRVPREMWRRTPTFSTMRLATGVFLVDLLLTGAGLASPAVGSPLALVLDIERDALSLDGVWERLREQETAEAWRPEVAGQLGPWEAVQIPGPIVPGPSRAEHEMLRNVWVRRHFELDSTRGARDAVLRWGGIRFGATAYVNGREVGTHAPIGPHAIVLPRGSLSSSGAPDLEPVMWGNNPKEPVLVRIPHGRGEIVIALLRIVSRLDPASAWYDPVGEWLLINLIQR
jgi:hypothetical protein